MKHFILTLGTGIFLAMASPANPSTQPAASQPNQPTQQHYNPNDWLDMSTVTDFRVEGGKLTLYTNTGDGWVWVR